jgi:hypothetical protein
MSLNHIIQSSVSDDEALSIKVKNIAVTGEILQSTSSLSYYGGLSPSATLPFLSEGITDASVIPPTECTMCLQTGKGFQVGYYVAVVTPAGVSSNTITLYCPYPDKLRQSLIENDPSVLNYSKINTLGYTFTIDNTNHNKASLTVSSVPPLPIDNKEYIKFEFHTDNGLPFSSATAYLFKIQHTQG